MDHEIDPRPWWSSRWAAVGAACVITIGISVSASHIPADHGQRSIDALGIALGIAGAWSLLLRWVQPYLMMVVAFSALCAYALLNYSGGPAYLVGPLALFSFGLVRPRRELFTVAAALVIFLFSVTLLFGSWDNLSAVLGVTGWTGAAVLVGEVLRARSERAAARRETLQRAQHQGLVEQQLGLARDLHDSVAHALTAINVQAAIAERTVRRDPSAAAAAAVAIREASGTALTELTEIVRSLRAGDDSPTTPDRGLADIGTLVEQGRRGGLTVDLIEPPSAQAQVAPSVAGAAYRLVQEALTNAIRYAPGGRVRVVVDPRDGLLVSVRDDGGTGVAGPGAVHGSGHGLLGMGERVAATGGTLHHGPCQPSGFEVVGRWTQN
ncbi:sensor histidine kinase [Calidifontibacter terrae]